VIAIVIPTMDRADVLPDLVANIHAATETPHRIYLVMEVGDRESADAAAKLDTVDVFGEFGSCSVAINGGYWASDEPFVAVANDDCVFHPGWDTTALGYFSDTVHIVGLNDGSGDCKCFPLVRRSYIEQHSGVFDKPNTIFHTYKSQGPDTEFAFYAILRGVWAPAFDAIVEHRRMDPALHFKARDTINEDLDEYNRRWPQWDPERRMPPAVPTVSPS
jgi:hypothetical protein